MNFNYQPPPQSSASDKEKYRIIQDDLIAVQIANDKNISNARNQQFVLNVPQTLTPIESASPEQLLSDEAGNEMLAQQNLKQLKFRDQEVSDIMVQIRRDPQLSFTLLNANFPAIRSELEKRFNLKLITPTFFIDFLKAYLAKVSKSLGLMQYSTSKNASVDTVEEIKTILPDLNDLRFLRQQATNLNYDEATLSRLDELITQIPSEEEYADIAQLDAVTRQEALQDFLILTRDLPSNAQVYSLVQGIKNGTVDRRAFNDAMIKLLNSIDVTFRKPQLRQDIITPSRPTREAPFTPQLKEIEQEMLSMLKGRIESEKQTPMSTPVTQKIARNIWRSPAELPLKDIKNYLKENPNVASQLKDKSGERVRYTKLTKNRGSKGISIFDTNLLDIWDQEELPTTEGYGIGKYNPIQKQPRNTIRMGKGIAAVEQPSYKEFGKFCINMNHLENQDILNIKYKNCLGAVPSFKPTAISDIFRDFIIDLLESGKANTRVYNQISDEERKYFQKIASAAGVFKGMGLPVTVIDDEEKDVRRWEILRGQVTAGNNNSKLLEELRKLTVRLMNADRIKRKQGLDILVELSAM